MNNVRNQYRSRKDRDVRPVIVNVANFPAPSDGMPSLLSVDEVGTMFHEFGHALHGLLSRCNYKDVSGTNVARDFAGGRRRHHRGRLCQGQSADDGQAHGHSVLGRLRHDAHHSFRNVLICFGSTASVGLFFIGGEIWLSN